MIFYSNNYVSLSKFPVFEFSFYRFLSFSLYFISAALYKFHLKKQSYIICQKTFSKTHFAYTFLNKTSNLFSTIISTFNPSGLPLPYYSSSHMQKAVWAHLKPLHPQKNRSSHISEKATMYDLSGRLC